MNARSARTKTKSSIPTFTSYEEEARFWDTHDTIDFESEFKPIRIHVGKKLSPGITIRLDDRTLQNIRATANKQGVGPTALVRRWVLERLQQKRIPVHR